MYKGNEVASLEARLLKVIGKVQRVGFRRYALELAQEFGLAGYAKNLPDGSVQIAVQGEKDDISKFLELLKTPPLGEVKEIREEKIPVDPSIREFRIVYGELGEELQEGFGAMQAAFMKYWEEFRDFRDESLKLGRETLSEIKGLKKDLKAILDERLARMEKDIAEMKAKLGLI